MKRQRHAAAIRMAKATVTAPLSSEDKTIRQQCGVEFAGGQRTQPGVVDVHAQTATTGRSKTVTVSGIGSPSSIISSRSICMTSWIFFSASSRVLPQVAAPCASHSGTHARHWSSSGSRTTPNRYDFMAGTSRGEWLAVEFFMAAAAELVGSQATPRVQDALHSVEIQGETDPLPEPPDIRGWPHGCLPKRRLQWFLGSNIRARPGNSPRSLYQTGSIALDISRAKQPARSSGIQGGTRYVPLVKAIMAAPLLFESKALVQNSKQADFLAFCHHQSNPKL